HGHAVHHRLDRELDELAILGARNVGHLHDARRHVARRGLAADLGTDALFQLGLERIAGPELQKEHDARVGGFFRRPELADRHRLLHLVDALDHAIDLRSADPYSAGVQRRVRATVNDHRAALGELGPVAVAPDVRVLGEVGSVVALTAAVVPEAERHRRKGPGAYEVARFVHHRSAALVGAVARHSELADATLAAP